MRGRIRAAAIKVAAALMVLSLGALAVTVVLYAETFGVLNVQSVLALNNVTLAAANTVAISSAFGTSPSVTAQNGTATFRINVGTGGSATTGVVAMGAVAAQTGWNCTAIDMTTNVVTRETSSTTTTVTFTAASAWTASDILLVNCVGY